MKTLVKLAILIIFSLTLQLAHTSNAAAAWCYPVYYCSSGSTSYGASGYGNTVSFGVSGHGMTTDVSMSFSQYTGTYTDAVGSTPQPSFTLEIRIQPSIEGYGELAVPFKLASMNEENYSVLYEDSPFANYAVGLRLEIVEQIEPIEGDPTYGAEVLGSDYTSVISCCTDSATFDAFYYELFSYSWDENTLHFFTRNYRVYSGDSGGGFLSYNVDIFESNKIAFYFSQEEVNEAYAAALSEVGEGTLIPDSGNGFTVVLVGDGSGNVNLELSGIKNDSNETMDIIATNPDGTAQNISEIIATENPDFCSRLRRRLRRLRRLLKHLLWG